MYCWNSAFQKLKVEKKTCSDRSLWSGSFKPKGWLWMASLTVFVAVCKYCPKIGVEQETKAVFINCMAASWWDTPMWRKTLCVTFRKVSHDFILHRKALLSNQIRLPRFQPGIRAVYELNIISLLQPVRRGHFKYLSNNTSPVLYSLKKKA